MRALRHRSMWLALARLAVATVNALVGLYIFYLLWRDSVAPAITHFPERPVGLLFSPQVLLDIFLGVAWAVACDALLRDGRRRDALVSEAGGRRSDRLHPRPVFPTTTDDRSRRR